MPPPKQPAHPTPPAPHAGQSEQDLVEQLSRAVPQPQGAAAAPQAQTQDLDAALEALKAKHPRIAHVIDLVIALVHAQQGTPSS